MESTIIYVSFYEKKIPQNLCELFLNHFEVYNPTGVTPYYGTYPGFDLFTFCLYPSVLRIRDVFPGFLIRIFPSPIKDQKDSGF
jgi:hypothetical protein